MPVRLVDLADQLGMDRSALRKWCIKAGFQFSRTSGRDTRGQSALTLSDADAEQIRADRAEWAASASERLALPEGAGYFYVIALIPEWKTERVKLGFALNIESRLKDHQCAAPTAALLTAWPSKPTWENCAIASLTRIGCEQVGNEVYDCDSVEQLIQRGNQFFALLPDPHRLADTEEDIELQQEMEDDAAFDGQSERAS
jgi:hypothetical protein